MDCELNDISRVFTVVPNAQKKLPLPRFMSGQYLSATPNLHQISGLLLPNTVRPCADRWVKQYPNIKPLNSFPCQQPILFNPISNKGEQVFMVNPAFRSSPQIQAWTSPGPTAVLLHNDEATRPVFSKPWHKPYTPEARHTSPQGQHDKTTMEMENAPKESSTPAHLSEVHHRDPTRNGRKGAEHSVQNMNPNYPKCNMDTFVKSMGLVSVKSTRKPSVWLNITLQVDTSSEIKKGQPVAQYRSIISTVLTELYFPPKLSPPDQLYSDKILATASYDERGRLTVLQAEFITAGIYKVESTSERDNTLGKATNKSVTLTRLDSLESLDSKSQYLILGDLCPVPKVFPKCHRNAQILHKKLIEFTYTREFRKYTLPLLAQVGEEDVWTAAIKAPRTRSRASEYDGDQLNKLFVKRKPSSPKLSNEDKEESQRQKRTRYSRDKSPVKRFPSKHETAHQTETNLPRRSRRKRGSPLEEVKLDLQRSEDLLRDVSSLNSHLTAPSLTSLSIVQLPASPHSPFVSSPESSSSEESDFDSWSSESGQSVTSISGPALPLATSVPYLDHTTTQFATQVEPFESSPSHDFILATSCNRQVEDRKRQLHASHEAALSSASGRTSPLTTLSEQTTELLSHLISTAATSDYSPKAAADNLLPSYSCNSYPLTSQLYDILSTQTYPLDPFNSVTDSFETVTPIEPLDMPELTFWDDLSLPLDLSLPSSDFPLDLSCKSNCRI